MEEKQQDLLGDIVTESQLTPANGWKRFANFLIDYFIYYIFNVIMIVLWNLADPKSLRQEGGGANFSVLMLSLGIFILYYSMIEMLTKGRSIGKLITGTKVVNDDGSNITIGTAFKRSLSRLVPFDAFSALGTPPYPWHDRWNQTYVIDLKKSTVLSDVAGTN